MNNLPLVRQIFVLNAVVPNTATDQQVQDAYNYFMSTDPEKCKAMLAAGGYVDGPPWLTIIGIGAGAVALYFVWKNYKKTKKLDSYDYPDPDNDIRPRIKAMAHSMGRLGGAHKLGTGCGKRRSLNGFGDDKYEFEPEVRLEGFKRKKARR